MGNGIRSSIINYISTLPLTVSITSRVLLLLIRRAKLRPNPNLILSALYISNPLLSFQVTMRLRIHFKITKTMISKLLKIPKRLETRLQNDNSVRRPLTTSPSLFRNISINRYSSIIFTLISIAKIETSIII